MIPLCYTANVGGFLTLKGGTVSGERPGYLAYLLRLWCVKEEGLTRWRASLERPGDGERYVFGSLESACDFLQDRMEEMPEESPAPTNGERRGEGV